MASMVNPSSATNVTAPVSSPGTGLAVLHHMQLLELVVAALVFAVIHALRQKRRHGLMEWPMLGALPSLVSAVRSDNIYEWISQVLQSRNGTFRIRGPWLSSLNCVVTADPHNVEHLLKAKFPNFPKGPYFRDTVRDLLGDGIFNADDETWQCQRKTASIEFHSAKFRALTATSLHELVHTRLLPVLNSQSGSSVDLQEILLRLTFDNVCMIAFGVDPGCLREGLPEIPFAKAFEEATEETVFRFVMPSCIWKTMRFLNIGFERILKEAIKGVDEFADSVIRTRKKELSLAEDDVSITKKSDLLTVFMGLRDEKSGERFSDKFLRDICVNFILAGRDTSSVALSWFFWLVDRNPAVEERILEEVCRVVGEREKVVKKESDDGDSEIESDDVVFRADEIKRMDYLQAAISEALRLYPSVPMDHKEVVEDDKFPDGTELKKGTKVIYAIYAMGRTEAIWGKDCLEYRPERWLRDGRYASESAYKFTAFNGGPRLCLGKDFAYFQMKYVAASILLRYRVHVIENHPVLPKLALTMYMKHGLKVNLHKRQRSEIQKYFHKV